MGHSWPQRLGEDDVTQNLDRRPFAHRRRAGVEPVSGYRVEKIATRLLYIEDGKAHVFDRLTAFEEWLESSGQQSRDPHSPPLRGGGISQRERQKLSKNKLEQLEKAIADVERKIADVEGEIAQLELSFQNPTTGTDWESTHRRYADLKVMLEQLYQDLARHWELMGQ